MLDTLTHSRTQSFKTCRRRHWLEYELGLRPTIDARALRMGTAHHAGLDVWKKTHDSAAAVEAARNAYPPCPEAFDANDWEIDRETTATLVNAYCWRWGNSQHETIASEISFRIPLVNPDTGAKSTLWELAGKIDGIIRLKDGRLAVEEEKTVSEDVGTGAPYWQRLQIDTQASIYMHAARALGYDVATVLWSVTRKPTIKPTAVPILDGDGLKVVLDATNQRVRNASHKAKKSCAICGGTGQDKRTPEARAQLNAEIPDCQCTFGDFRQTGDTAKGYTVQTRPMTTDEWCQKLADDIGERADFYFARMEIPRLDSEILEMQGELWEIQKTIRAAQNENRWFRTVSTDSCPWCPFFGLCASKWTPDAGTPEGFQFVENKFPEL